MKVYCKTTLELTQKELELIAQLFEEVFERKSSSKSLLTFYSLNVLGYSFHALIEDEGKIVGVNSYNPAYFYYKGEKKLFVNSLTTMVAKSHRDFFSFYDMVTTAYDYLPTKGVSFVFGYPNHNSYPVLKKSKLMLPIGKMNIYCLPYRIGGIKPALSWMNMFSKIGTRLFVLMSSLWASSKIESRLIEKEVASFNETRYKRSNDYVIAEDKACSFVYRIRKQENIRTAFLIDVNPKSSINFNRAIRYIINKENQKFDLLMYVGNINVAGTGMIKIPEKYEPKKFNFMGKVLDEKGFDERIWDIENWDTNLSNYDLI